MALPVLRSVFLLQPRRLRTLLGLSLQAPSETSSLAKVNTTAGLHLDFFVSFFFSRDLELHRLIAFILNPEHVELLLSDRSFVHCRPLFEAIARQEHAVLSSVQDVQVIAVQLPCCQLPGCP